MFINSLFLAISSSIDSLGIGITYGIKGTKISYIANFILFLIYWKKKNNISYSLIVCRLLFTKFGIWFSDISVNHVLIYTFLLSFYITF